MFNFALQLQNIAQFIGICPFFSKKSNFIRQKNENRYPFPPLCRRTPVPTMNGGIRSFVRRRRIVRTRIRTPHPSAFGCHLPPLGKACGKCEQRHGRFNIALRFIAHLLRKYVIAPTNVNQYTACNRKIMRTTLRREQAPALQSLWVTVCLCEAER